MAAKSSYLILGLAVSAMLAGSAWAQQFKISIGVRETGSTAPIGQPSAPSNAGTIEWVAQDAQTLTADGSWQKFVFNFGTDPVTNFAGNGILDGTTGVFEHLRVLNHQGVTDQVRMLVDDVVNTVGGVDHTIADFESVADGALALFQNANFSGSTSTNVVAGGLSRVTSTGAHSGSKSAELTYQFVDNTASRWIRFPTSANSANPYANPTIDFSNGNQLSFWLNATVPQVVVGWNTDSDGDWSDAGKWAGPGGVPNTASEIARLLATTAPRTINVDQDFTINGININSNNTYTISGSSKLTLNSPAQSGIDGTLVVQAGSHVITAPLAVRSPRLAASVPAGASLKTPGIVAEGAGGEDFSDVLDFVKTGTGNFETGHLRFDLATISGGTVKITSDGTDAATSELNTLTFAGGTAPTAKLDLTNNALIIDWDSTADPARPNALFSTRNRIINGFNGGDWLGNGITSSAAAANSLFALGYGDAATLEITSFGGRGVDNEATLVVYTRKGDADLNKVVNFSDLLIVAQNYDPAYDPSTDPRLWSQGDFTYDGIVNFNDLLALAQNYGATALTDAQIDTLGSTFAADWTLARSLVPEPTTLGLIGAMSMVLRRRR